MIGLVNKVWSCFGHFLDEFVKDIGEVEADCKDKVIKHTVIIENIADEFDIHTVNKIKHFCFS